MVQKSTIDIQERTFKFGIQIIKFVDKLPRTLAGTELGRQLIRSGTVIAANMEEAKYSEQQGPQLAAVLTIDH